ncbi:MAG: phosphotransferase [Gemmatimonadota bacterium]|nr:phosphotransferase [Gemmatimonadota bacterium]
MTGTRGLVDRASALFEDWHGELPTEVGPVAGDGSARRYWRLSASDGASALGAYGPDRDENRAFFSFSRTFRGLGLAVPDLYAVDEPAGVWLLEDLGDTTLFEAVKAARGNGSGEFPESMLPLYRRVLEELPRFQIEGGRSIDFRRAYPRSAFDRQSILWDLNYFKYHFLKLAHIPFNEAKLEKDFGKLARFLLGAERDYFLYRDFQSRNVMVREGADGGEPWFIDYQGGRRGALQYDVASLLYDAKANLDERLRGLLLDHYLRALSGHHPVERDRFMETWGGYVLVRILQALGAYGYRGFFERKPRFLQSVPYAAANIAGLLEDGLELAVPELEGALRRVVERWGPGAVASEGSPDRLTVSTGSFRFASGYPQDTSGHGGGYVFDCRGLPNPGRLEEYRGATGLDPEVVAYLERQPEVEAFWERARALVDAHVAEFRQRGFSQLSVYFGCTGGQHRSVYFAERLARYLAERSPEVGVSVVHRESADWPR